MILNDVFIKQNVFTKIALKDGDKELPKELKVKVMRIRMAYSKLKKNFDDELQEFANELLTSEFKELSEKLNRTSEEETRYNELMKTINEEYQEFITQKSKEEVTCVEDTLTEDEYADILEVNAGNDIEINGNKIPAADFMEIVYELFVK